MTNLGKTLAFVNLLFSLFTAGLIVTVFVTRTNWKAGHDRLANEKAVMEKDRDTWKARAEDERNAQQRLRDDYDKQVKEKDGLLEMAKKQNEDLTRKFEQLQTQVSGGQAQNEGAVAELNRRRDEVKLLTNQVEVRNESITKLEEQVRQANDSATESRIQVRSLQDREQNLLAQIETLTQNLEKARLSGGGLPGAGPGGTPAIQTKNPPLDDVEGIVKAVDPSSGLVTISIGSDAGVNRGNTLEVFRLGARPTYVGTLRVMDVKPHEAVGRMTDARRGKVQRDDRVASDILPRR